MSRPNKRTRLVEWSGEEGKLSAELRGAATIGWTITDERDDLLASASASNRYTADGLRDKVREHSINEMRKIKDARKVLAKANDRIAELERETALPAPDRSEAASRVRDRIWRQIERLPQGPERERTVMSLAERNPIVAETLREMPRELSGVAASTYDEIVGRLAEATHGPKLAELKTLRERAEVAAWNLDAAEEDLRLECGVFSPADWAAQTAHIKPTEPTPWLRKDGDRVIVVDMEKRVGRTATAEDIEKGVFFKSFEEFKAANAA